MTVTRRGYTAASSILAGGTVACPAGVQAGDLMFMFCTGGTTLLETNKTPDGWVEILALRHAENVPSTGDAAVRTFVRSAGASEPATYTTGFDSAVWIGIYVLYSSTGAGLKIDTTGSYFETVTTGTHVIPSITMSAAGMRLDFVMYSTQFSASNPAGSTEEQDVSMGSQRYQLFTEPVSSGATGTRTTSTTSNLNRVKASTIGVIEGTFVQQLGPQFRSETFISPATSSSLTTTMTAPANMQVGDLLMAQITVLSGASVPSITGWTTLITTSGSFPLTYVFYKTAVAGDIGASVTVNWSNTTSRNYTYFNIAIFSPNGYTLLIDTSATSTYAAAATVVDFPSVTTIYANELIILISANNCTTTARNGHKDSVLHQHTSTNKSSLWSSYQPAAGATTAYQMTQSSVPSGQRNSTIAIFEILAPADPSGLTATPTSSSAITVSWVDNSTSEANFELEHSTDGSSWALLTSPAANVTSYNHTGLGEHTIHYYRIRAYNAAGYSGYSNTGSTYTDLIAPSGLTATVASNSQINLAWTDNSGAESGYKVEQSANGTTGWSVINTTAAGATSYSVTGLSQNTIYYFRVRAYNGSDFSAYTSVANATTLPTAPSDLAAAAASTTQINLTWTDSASGETGYKLERSPDNSTWAQIATPAANDAAYSDTGLTEGTLYYYRIRPYTSSPAQNGAYSNTASATTTPAAPSALVATAVGPSEIDLTWTDNSHAETGFKVERSPDNSTWAQIATTGAGVAAYNDTGLDPATTYYYRVRAYQGAVNSAYSNTATTTTIFTTPSDLAAVAASTTQINLTWTDTAVGEDGYKVEQSTDDISFSQIATTAASATGYSATGLTEGTLYYFRVRPYVGATNGLYSNEASATTTPAAPSALVAAGLSDSEINLTWTDNSHAETTFRVERSTDNATWSEIGSSSAGVASYADSGLSPSTLYYYRVRARQGAANSAYSTSASATTAPPAPTGLAGVAVLSSKINLTWTDTSTAGDGFKVERSANGTTGWAQIGTATPGNNFAYSDTGLSASTIYYYRVRAYKGSANSPYSSVANQTTLAALTAPTGITATAPNAFLVNIAWTDEDSGVTGYKVERTLDPALGWTEIASVATSPYLDSSVAPETLYYYRVRAFRSGSIEYSSYSSTATITTPFAPQGIKGYNLFLLAPAVVFSAVVNMGSVGYPIDEVAYDGATGDYTDIYAGMTISFGSAPGGHDRGRQRVRKAATSDSIPIGRSSRGKGEGEIDLVDNCYLTVYDEYRVWSKTPYFTDAGAIYKDSDIPAGDNTQKPPPVSNCGPGFAGSVAAGIITVRFTSTSFATAAGATLSAYLWDIADGTMTAGSLSGSTVTATFPAGFRWVHLTVTDSNGKSHTSHCPVYARTLDDGTVRNFQIAGHSIKPEGQTLSVNIKQSIPDYPDGCLVMLWNGEADGPADRRHMQFIGWHQSDPTQILASRTGTIKETVFDCLDVAGRLALLPGYSQILEHSATPADWLHFKDPNMDLYIHYLLHWHSTALEVGDFQWTGTDAAYAFQALQSDEMSLHAQVDTHARKILPDWIFVCNRRGQMAIKPDPMIQNTDNRTSVVQVALTASDYSNLRFTGQYWPRVKKILNWALITGTGALRSIAAFAPGPTPGQGLNSQEQTEGLAVSQAALNDATGRRYARANSPYSPIRLTLAYGDNRNLEPAALTWVTLDLPAAVAAQRGLTFDAVRCLISELTIRYDYGRTGTMRTVELTLEVETVGAAGTTYIPETTEPIDSGGWTPTPAPAPPAPPHAITPPLLKAALFNNHGQILKTSNFQGSPPFWVVDNTIPLSDIDNFGSHPFHSAIVDPFSPLYRELGTTVNIFATNRTGIFKITDIFAVEGDPEITLLYTWPYQSSTGRHREIMASFGRYFSAEEDNPWLMVSTYYNTFHINEYTGVKTVFSKDAGVTWSDEFEVTGYADLNAHGHGAEGRPGIWLSPRTPGKARTVAFKADTGNSADPTVDQESAIYESSNWGESWGPIGVAATPGNELGGVIHVPWDDNADESLIYYGRATRVGGAFSYFTMRGDEDITPTVDGHTYGPWRYPFGIRAYDNDRQKMVMVGRANDVDNISESSQSNGKAAVFVSSDAGDSWTCIVDPMDANVNDYYPDNAAFSANDPNVIFIWGNEGYVAQTTDFGATVVNKEGNIHDLNVSSEQHLCFVGGDS